MSITAECTACGRKYQAPASMAGKRVRCKQCGNVFALPDVGSGGEEADQEAMAKLEKSYHSVDATGHGEDTPSGNGDDEYGESVAPLRQGRSNVRFNFPFAKELDQWLPTVLTIAGLAWLGWQSYIFNQTSAKWLSAIWLAVALIGFFAFIGPLTLTMIRRAGKQLGFHMPASDRSRAIGVYLPAFAIACVLWTMGDGALISLILGSIIGVLIATVFLWLLFRLQPSEIAPTAGYALLGFAIGMGITGGIAFGLNKLLIETMVATKSPDVLPASPFGPAMSWITDEDRQRIAVATAAAATKPAPRTGNQSTDPEPGPVVPTPPAPAPVALSAIVKSIETAPINAAFDEVIRPLTNSSFVALSKASGSNATIDLWDTSNWTKRGSAPFTLSPDHPDENHFVLSPDGDRLAHIVRFPGLLAQVWSFSQNVASDVSLEGTGSPELLGFLDSRHLLVRRQKQSADSLEIQEIPSKPFELPPPAKSFEVVKHAQAKGTNLVVNDAGTMVAIAAKVANAPKIQVYDLTQTNKMSSTTIASLDPSLPVEPTGMAFSADGKQVAILFERGGAGFLVSYIIEPGKPDLTPGPRRSFPVLDRSSQFTGSALAWLPDAKTWLLYGQGIFDCDTGKKLGELGVANVETSRVHAPGTVVLTVKEKDNTRQIRVLQLDMEKIATLAK